MTAAIPHHNVVITAGPTAGLAVVEATAARQEAADLIAVAVEAIAGLLEAAAAIAAVVVAVTAGLQAEVVAVLAVVVAAVALADLRTHRAVGRTAISK